MRVVERPAVISPETKISTGSPKIVKDLVGTKKPPVGLTAL
jgi:hypothetical protein